MVQEGKEEGEEKEERCRRTQENERKEIREELTRGRDYLLSYLRVPTAR